MDLMNMQQMTDLTAECIEQSQFIKENNQNAAELKERIHRTLNTAYLFLARAYCGEIVSQQVTLDEYSCFATAQLLRPLIVVRKIIQDNRPQLFMRKLHHVEVFAPAGTSVTVEYECVPEELAYDASTPNLDSGLIPHEAICYLAASLLWGQSGARANALYYDTLYKNMLSHLQKQRSRLLPAREWR